MKYLIETITPVHIGSGDSAGRLDYVKSGNEIIIVDIDKLITKLEKPEILSEEIERQAEKFSMENFLAQQRIAPALVKKYSVRFAQPPVGEIPLYIKSSANQPYIPGSSIKGGILSALYWYLLSTASKKDVNLNSIIKACLTKDFRTLARLKVSYEEYKNLIVSCKKRGREEFTFNDTLMNVVFSSLIEDAYKREYAPMWKFASWIEVSDTTAGKIEDMYVALSNVWGARRKISIYYELLRPKTRLEFDIIRQYSAMSEREILEITDLFYSKVLEKEVEWCKKNRVDLNFEEIGKEKYKLRLGQGSTSLATSLLILAEDLGIKEEYLKRYSITRYREEPRTRKLVFENGKPKYLLGWAKIKTVD